MSLASRIIFVASMLACAVLCAWAAISFGGPATTPMWGLAGLCVVISVVVWFLKAPKELENVRVEGVLEPTFRLARFEPGARGEIWQLVLGNARVTLIRPDGTPATTFARKWAETAIALPGLVSGELLRVVREDWSPPDETHWLAEDIVRAAKSIRRPEDRDTDYYWFSPSNEVIEQIEDYKRQTIAELGVEAAVPLRIKARQCILSGLAALGVGIGIVAFRFTSAPVQAVAPANSGTRALAFAGVITLIGVWRIGRGIGFYGRAGQVVK
jgi:hypothetical protein